MSPAARLLVRAYRACLRLYPRSFHAEYAEEMAGVFTQSCRQAAASSSYALFLLALRELRDLPLNLAREYRSQWSKKPMSNPSDLPANITRAALRGMLIFGLSFVLVYLLYCALDTLLNAGKFMGQGASIWNVLILHPTALASGLGTAFLGRSLGWRRAWASALLVFLAYTLFFRLTRFAFQAAGTQPEIAVMILLQAGFQTLAGLLIGASAGWVQRGRHAVVLYALAGAAGFILGWLADTFLSTSVYAQIPFPGDVNSLVVGSLRYFAWLLVTALTYGAATGFFLGLASFLRPEKSQAVTA
jgi:hypothetical protein